MKYVEEIYNLVKSDGVINDIQQKLQTNLQKIKFDDIFH